MPDWGLPAELLPDETLLAGLAAGDTNAAVAFVRRFQRKVFGIAITVLGEPGLAEDVAQQTFERVWRHAAVFDTRRGSVAGWISTIARNLAIDAARIRRPDPVDPETLLELLGADRHGPEQHLLAAETSDELRHALATLPRPQARALVMAAVSGMTAKQVAETEGVPLGTAKTRIRDGLMKLRAALGEHHDTVKRAGDD